MAEAAAATAAASRPAPEVRSRPPRGAAAQAAAAQSLEVDAAAILSFLPLRTLFQPQAQRGVRAQDPSAASQRAADSERDLHI